MNDKFLNAFKEALETEEDVKMEDIFRDFAEWDSLSRLSLIAMLDSEFNVQIENQQFEELKTVGDIYNYVKAQK